MSSKIIVASLALALASTAVAAQVSVTQAWVRATVPGQHATGAFMQLTSPADSSLVGVASSAAKAAELHSMALENGVMKMRAIEALALPAGKTVELAPGGYHVMLLDLATPLREGERVPVTLTFVDKTGRKSTQTVEATVRPLTASAAHPKH